MDKLYDKPIKPVNALIGILILALGFMNLTRGYIIVIAQSSLAITGLAAFGITYGLDSIKMLFNRPIKPVKNFLIFLLISFVTSFVIGMILTNVLKLNLTANPVIENIPWIKLPMMLLGEELISFFAFFLIASLLRNHSKKVLFATIGSALVFALLHIPTYWNGSFLLTLIHVILLQGVARLIFNTAGIKSNTILVPWLIHFAFDALNFILIQSLS